MLGVSTHDIDARSYGFYGLSNSSSIWGFPNTTLSAPVLNISAFYIDGSLSRIYGKDWVDPRTGTTWFSDWSNMTYAYNNVTYSVQSLEKDNIGQCQPDGVSIAMPYDSNDNVG